MRLRAKFLVNPAAGGLWRKDMGPKLAAAFGPVDMAATASREDATAKTRDALAAGFELIVAVGGDGTVNAVVQGFFSGPAPLKPGAMLAVAGLGTGSDYHRSLSVSGRDWRSRVQAPRPRLVDVGVLDTAASDSGGRGGASEKFVNMASFGLSALVVRGKNSAPKWHPAFLRYLLPTVACALRCKPQTVRITAGERTFERPLLAVLVAKGQYAGGGMKLGSGALDDGQLTVTLVGPLAPLTVLTNLHRLYSGAVGSIPGVEQLRTAGVTIESETPWAYEIDGEARPALSYARISLLAKSLLVAT